MQLEDDWEFNVLGLYNYRQPGHLRHYFDFIIENHDSINGDICEAGVFKGHSLLAMGLLLKELGSEKRVYGFDSFSGFPPVYDVNDDLEKFDELFIQGLISKKQYDDVRKNIKLRSFTLKGAVSSKNVSLSGNFSETSLEELQKKIEFLGLDNITLIQGPFTETMDVKQAEPFIFMAGLVDCDLYQSYKVVLPFIWASLTIGGYLYLDEYYSLKFPGARIASDEFFADKNAKPQIHIAKKYDFERWYVRKLNL